MRLRSKLFLGFLSVIAVVVAVVAVLVRQVAAAAVSSHMGGMMNGMGGMMADVDAAVTRGVTEALLLGALAAVVVAGVASYLLSGLLTRTIGEMALAARRIAAGDYDHRVAHPADDEIGRFAVAFNDMAGRLAETERIRRELLATISHELRTPLTNIQGYMEGLMDGVVVEEPATYQLVHREAARLSRLVADVESLSRVEAGAERIVPRGLDAGRVAREVVDRLRPQFEQKPLALAVEIDPETPPVWADEDRLVQVLMNVVGNAYKYTPPEGTVALRVGPETTVVGSTSEKRGPALPISGPAVFFEVRDSGIGIPEEDLPHVFERFYRVEKSRSVTGGGLGIGLAVVKSLVEQMGGRVRVESERGSGTRMLIALPAAKRHSSTAS
ncbi:MAG: sensor histidine kinase [Thermoleophilia bacterium]